MNRTTYRTHSCSCGCHLSWGTPNEPDLIVDGSAACAECRGVHARPPEASSPHYARARYGESRGRL